MIKVSVILIAYNAEFFLERALKSLKNQSYSNIEIIMVDDGSTDSTSTIMKEFTSSDIRFKYFYKDNGGVASARNFGITNTTGDFIIHHDADDYMPKHAIKDLVEHQLRTKCDIVIANYSIIINENSFLKSQKFEGNWLQYIDGLINNDYHGALWNKLISKNLYRDLNFVKDVNYMEDLLLLVKMLVKYKPSISYLDSNIYNYIQYESSITHKISDKSLNDIKTVIINIEKYLKDNGVILSLNHLKFQYKLLAILNKKNIDFKNDFKEINSHLFKIKKNKFIHKLMIWCKIYEIDFISNLIIKYK